MGGEWVHGGAGQHVDVVPSHGATVSRERIGVLVVLSVVIECQVELRRLKRRQFDAAAHAMTRIGPIGIRGVPRCSHCDPPASRPIRVVSIADADRPAVLRERVIMGYPDQGVLTVASGVEGNLAEPEVLVLIAELELCEAKSAFREGHDGLAGMRHQVGGAPDIHLIVDILDARLERPEVPLEEDRRGVVLDVEEAERPVKALIKAITDTARPVLVLIDVIGPAHGKSGPIVAFLRDAGRASRGARSSGEQDDVGVELFGNAEIQVPPLRGCVGTVPRLLHELPGRTREVGLGFRLNDGVELRLRLIQDSLLEIGIAALKVDLRGEFMTEL